MSYIKQEFVSGQILKAEHLNHMENGIGQLSEEKADRSEIPEAYTLPVATADTLGGVKVGDGLEILDGVLGVKAGNYSELIEEVTTNADVHAFSRSSFPDGNPYNLKKLIVLTQIPACNTDFVFLRVTFNDGWTYNVVFSPMSTEDAVFARFDALIHDDGVLELKTYTPVTNPNFESFVKSYSNPICFTEKHTIARFELITNSNDKVIPSGTLFYITGVRA